MPTNTDGAQGRSVSTEQDSVRRLAEIRARLDAKAKFSSRPDRQFYAHSHSDITYLLSLIDSLGNRIAEYERQDVVWVTRDEAAWLDQRADIEQRIDSLTAERDRMKDDLLRLEWWEATCGYWHEQANSARASAEALNDLWGKTIDRIDAIARRAEAAEAEVKRLREAIREARHQLENNGDVGHAVAEGVLADALATPPSEGGQS